MAGKSRQRGISLLTLIFFLAVIGAVGAVGMRAFPSIIEYQAALKTINRVKDEGTVGAVRAAFDRAAQIDNITSITGKDLEITKDGERVVVSFAYEKEFHLFGPAWLTLKYAGTSQPGR
jgi:hypothetical protein